MTRKETKAGFATSLIVGMLLIPLSAVAAFAIVSGSTLEDETPIETPISMAVDTTIAPETTPAKVDTITILPVEASADDLAAACGEDGLTLIDLETNETISDIQQAALDALRQVFAEAGLDLPDPAAPEPIVRTVTVVSASASSSPSATAPAASSGGAHGDDHEYEDDHHEDEEDHHEYEEDHEEDEKGED